MMQRKYLRAAVLFASCLGLLLLASAVSAGFGDGVTFTPTCSGYDVRGGSLVANRDNTGRGRELFVVTARDGMGNIIYENQTVYPLNQRFLLATNDQVKWTKAPQFNPIVMQIASVSGNGQPEELVYAVTGNCDALATYGSGVFMLGDNLTLYPIFEPADGRISPPYDPNAIPPRPVNPPGLVESLPGYAIVNTDNLFLRSGDGADYAPVGIVDGGTRLVVLGSDGKTGDSLWWYVEVGGMRGWVKSSFLILRGDLRGLPIVPVEGGITQPTLYVGVMNPIYNTASIGGRWLCEIPGNRLYVVVGRDASTAAWYRIQATCNGQTILGWISADAGLLRNPGGVDIPIL